MTQRQQQKILVGCLTFAHESNESTHTHTHTPRDVENRSQNLNYTESAFAKYDFIILTSKCNGEKTRLQNETIHHVSSRR